MSMINPKMSLENEANRLDDSASRARLSEHRRKSFARKFYNEQAMWQQLSGGEAIGEPFQATMKEIKMMRTVNEENYIKALSKLKPGQPKPRLSDYRLIPKPSETKVEPKKLWEP